MERITMVFHTLELNERNNAGEGIRARLASVKQSFKATAHRLLAWLRATAPLHSRVAGEAFTRLQILACYAGAVLFLVILGLVGSMEGGVL